MGTFIVPIQPMEFPSGKAGPQVQPSASVPFKNVFDQVLGELERSTATARQDSRDLVLGNVNDLAQVQINALKAQTMLQTTVQLTTRAVNAYKEIMQMQV